MPSAQTDKKADTLASFDQFITSLREEFGEQGAGKKFEVFCKWFLENDPEWSKTVEKVCPFSKRDSGFYCLLGL